MQKSSQKFLAILLSIAMLLSFPIAAQASTASYEETFTGTYTAPEGARNVLVSGAAVSEWYGDRVNMGCHTYSVRQNQYGLNKDGNMLGAELGKTYTLWLAQYGVASIAFTAQEDGLYSVYSGKSEQYGHTPTYFEVCGYTTYIDEEDGKEYYSLRNREYGFDYSNDSDDDLVEYSHGYDVVYLSEGEEIYFAVSASTEYDSVVEFQIDKYTEEGCKHLFYYDLVDVDVENCKATNVSTCSYCGYQTFEEIEHHNYEESSYVDENCNRHVKYSCIGCGLVKYEYDYRDHSYKYFRTLIDESQCLYAVGYACIVCEDIDWMNTDYEHNYDWFDEYDGCENHFGYRCKTCGDVDWEEYDYDHNLDYDNKTFETDGCTKIYYAPCNDCNKIVPTYTQEQHYDNTYNPDTCTCKCNICEEVWESHSIDWETEEINHPTKCITEYTYLCNNCGERVVWDINEDHDILYDEIKIGCGIYDYEYCAYCDYEYIYEDPYWVEHNYDYIYYLDDDEELVIHEVCRCQDCGVVDGDDPYTVEPYELFVVDGHTYYNDYRDRTYLHSAGNCDEYLLTYHCVDKDCTATTEKIKKGHSYKREFVQITPQHDNVCGTYNFACVDCGEFIYDEPLTCHSNTEKWDATYCNFERRCQRCGLTETSTNHYCENLINVPATCTADSYDYGVCLDCGQTIVDYVYEGTATGHNPVSANNAVAPTCTTAGKNADTKCATCGTILTTGATINATGHNMVSLNNAVAPTCTTDGKNADTKCTSCGFVVAGSVIHATGHTVVNDKAVSATYAKAGKTAGSHCSVCNTVITAQKSVAKLVPPTIKFSKLTGAKKSFKATWKKNAKAAGYEIRYSTKKNMKSAKTVKIGKNSTVSKTVSKLSAKKTYYVQIRTVVKSGGKTYYSAWSTAKSVKTK